MRPFQYTAPEDIRGAIEAVSGQSHARFIAGGTGLLDLMKLAVEVPATLVDVHRLPLSEISGTEARGLRIGAMARNTTVADHPLVREGYPVLREALLAGASAQLRNMATVGGNLMQRTRCTYFRDVQAACNKRAPGSGCDAADGFHRMHAIFGTSDQCFATHPSDMCVALVCLDAVVEVQGPRGTRRIPIEEFHALPGATPHIETVVAHDELVIAVELPPPSARARSAYRKIRDRASYEFALVSAAVSLQMPGDTIADARVAFGGVATKPWRAVAVEQALKGKRPGKDVFRDAGEAAVVGAAPRAHNKFKVELLKRTLIRTLTELTGEDR